MRGLLLSCLVLFAINANATESRIWRIDSSKSQAKIGISLRIPLHPEGQFKSINGELTKLPELKMSVNLQLNVQDLKMHGPHWVQTSTLSESFLDVKNYPVIMFQSLPFSNQVLISGGDLNGMLTLKGKQRTVTFNVAPSTCLRPGFTCSIVGKGQVNRHDFGITANRWTVRDQVRFSFQLKFIENE